MRLLALLFILLLTLTGSFNFFGDEDFQYDPKRETILRNIPVYIKRSYKEYSSKSNCIDRVLRSTPATVKFKKIPRFDYKIHLPRRIGQVIEAYILLEFHKVPNINQVSNYNFSIDVQHTKSNSYPRQCLKVSEIVFHKNMIEIFFNVTQYYQLAKMFGRKKLNLNFHFLNVNVSKTQMMRKSLAGSEFTFKMLKSFFITHEYNANCTTFLNQINLRSKELLNRSKRWSMLRAMTTQHSYPVDHNPKHACHLTDWYVSFHSIGWSSFVIAPSEINARACSGVCKFPLLVNSTQHALLQTAVSATKNKETSVCCVPIRTESSTLVLSDDLNGSVYVIKYPNLVAKTCGCL